MLFNGIIKIICNAGSTEPVKVDTLLMKVSNKKRKVNNCPVETVSFPSLPRSGIVLFTSLNVSCL